MRIVGRDWIALACLAAAACLGGRITLRSTLGLGATWSDGERQRSLSEDALRYAVWDAPRPLAMPDDATRLALSRDGRWAAFSSGEPGLNAELWLAEVEDGSLGEARPLAELNSAFDELAPAFGEGELIFASNRTGGGFDLYRARFAGGVASAPEPVGGAVLSEYDELDPCPVPGTRELLFVSDRPRDGRTDYDLYHALPDGSVEPLGRLNTLADEREPSLSSDGRALVFAADAGETRGFDLYESFREQGAWLPRARIETLCSERCERAPIFAHDAFELAFAVETAPGRNEFQRARSLEVVRVPPPPPGLQELLLLALLVLTGLLAWLSRRWTALDILYKCFLVSLLMHLLLLLWLREVYPERGALEPGPGERTFRVRLESPSADRERERAGEIELEARRVEAPESAPDRLGLELAEVPARPQEVALPAPERPETTSNRAEAAPRAAVEVAPAPALAEREVRARHDAAAPELALEARDARASQPPMAAGPERAATRALEGDAPAPAATALPELAAESDVPALAALAERTSLAPGARASDAPSPAVRVPRAEPQSAQTERASVAFDALSGLPAERGAKAPTTSAAAPERRGPAAAATSMAAARPSAAGVPSLADDGSGAREAAAHERKSLAPRTSAGSEAAVALRAPRAEPTRAGADEQAAPFDALEGLTRGSEVARATPTPAQPRRASAQAFDGLDGLARSANAERAGPSREAPGRSAASSPPALPELAAAPLAFRALESMDVGSRPRLEQTPYKNRFGAKRLRALEEFGGSAETERAVASGLAYLARIQGSGGPWGDARDFHEKYGDVRVGKTGLALLAFLGAGHSALSGSEHSAVVERALGFLLGEQDDASGHFGRSSSYDHGIATYALAECFALTKEERLRAALESAVAHILACQSREPDPRFFGGWGYYLASGEDWRPDPWPRVSVSAWQVMALESARLGGLDVPERAFDDARTFLARAWDPRRRAFRYSHDPERLSSGYPILPASTPAAIFALSLLGADVASDEFGPARRFVLERSPDGYRYTGDGDFVRRARGNLYFWYYGTLAMFRAGGADWERWNAAMKETLLPAQEQDGSWRLLDVYAEYAGDEDGNRAYTTAMCVLALEIYYRYFTPLLAVR